ncbi:MAG: autoinducer binding domain-containing protein [Thermodesulfobacteriota bacterium]
MLSIARNFPKQELISILELIDELSICHTHKTAESLLTRTKDLLRADCAVCGMGSIDENGAIKIKTIVDSGYPGEWLNLYFKEGLYRYDPVVRYHMQFSEPELWSNIRQDIDDEKARAVTDWADAYGLKHGISSSVYIPATGMFSLFCFASAEDAFNERHKGVLNALTLHLNMAITESSGDDPSERKTISATRPLIQ